MPKWPNVRAGIFDDNDDNYTKYFLFIANLRLEYNIQLSPSGFLAGNQLYER